MKQVTLHVKEDAFSEYWQQRKFDVNDKEGNHITTVATKNDGETLFEIEDLHPNLTTFLAGFVGYQDKSERIKLLKAQALKLIQENVQKGEHHFNVNLTV